MVRDLAQGTRELTRKPAIGSTKRMGMPYWYYVSLTSHIMRYAITTRHAAKTSGIA